MSRITNALYQYFFRLFCLARHSPPAGRRDAGPGIGESPPPDLVEQFPNYHANASAFRLQSRWLHDQAFQVAAETLQQFVDERVDVDLAALRHWMSGPRGAIFACPHYGPFVGAALLFAAEGTPERPANVFYDAATDVPQNERFDVLFERFERTIKILHNQPNDLIKAARALRNKQCISIMFDVVQKPSECMYVPFFDRLYPAMGGAAFLAQMSKASIIPAYAVPIPGRRLHIEFGHELRAEDFSRRDKEQSIFEMTCALFKDLERQLTAMPWHWIYWGNLRHAPRYADTMIRNEASLRAEIRRRLQASSQLLKAAPALRGLLDAG